MFSNGILILGGVAALLLALFGGATHALIPLYAVGVFLSFTLSQASMVRRWLTRREAGWRWRWGLNAVGAVTTGLVMLVIAVTKGTLVACYFMHLLSEKKVIYAVLILTVVFFIVLMSIPVSGHLGSTATHGG